MEVSGKVPRQSPLGYEANSAFMLVLPKFESYLSNFKFYQGPFAESRFGDST